VLVRATMANNIFSSTGVTVYTHEDGYELEEATRKGKCQACGGKMLGVLRFRKHWICPSCKRAWLTKEKVCGKIKRWVSFVGKEENKKRGANERLKN
jgi:tRNA(Ile2) C34 agmatinyltransferase TiaS